MRREYFKAGKKEDFPHLANKWG